MKKIILLLIIISSFFIGGCENKQAIGDEKDLMIKLFFAPTTGEYWEYDVSSSDIVQISEDYESNCDDDVEGCGGYNIYKISPKEEGVVIITFILKPNSDTEYSRFAKYTITVDKNLNITESHTGTYFNE